MGSGAANKHAAALTAQPLRRHHGREEGSDAFARADPEVRRLLVQHIEAIVRVWLARVGPHRAQWTRQPPGAGPPCARAGEA